MVKEMMKINYMESPNQSSSFYNEAIDLFDRNAYEAAIDSIKGNISILENYDDLGLAYLNCGFLYHKLENYSVAIDYFSKSISCENKLENLKGRSKDISFNARSTSKYKNDDYRGAIEDKRKAKKITLFEGDQFLGKNNQYIDYKSILLETFVDYELEPKYSLLIKISKIVKSKYDLIEDYKNVISQKRKEEVIKKLEDLSDLKYKCGDYKGSIKAIRRAEKYY